MESLLSRPTSRQTRWCVQNGLRACCHAQGRHVLWGWLQERRKAGSYDYSGCMTVPRLLYIEDERLIQVPGLCTCLSACS